MEVPGTIQLYQDVGKPSVGATQFMELVANLRDAELVHCPCRVS